MIKNADDAGFVLVVIFGTLGFGLCLNRWDYQFSETPISWDQYFKMTQLLVISFLLPLLSPIVGKLTDVIIKRIDHANLSKP